MNVLLMVVDSLRSASLGVAGGPRTPFLDRLGDRWHCFSRAYSTECWTLPSHISMFTGLMPSDHGAHFGSMGYYGSALTLAEHLAKAGYLTEIVTRNPVFDPSMPGVLRGFKHRTSLNASRSAFSPGPILLALTKPRLRRQIRETGFFHPDQAENARFVMDFARRMIPADSLSLSYLLDRIQELQRRSEPFFLFCNLFDVHAPYSPVEDSILEPMRSFGNLRRNGMALRALALTGRHQYLQEGFGMPKEGQRLLLERYHRAIELMDQRLDRFFREAEGLLGNTLVILCGDHGEAFGEHELYLHDASVFETNLHVPLWIRYPGLPGEPVKDLVSLRSLFELSMRASSGNGTRGTILDAEYRERNPVVLAEHFYYSRLPRMREQFRHNLAAAISERAKVICRGSKWEHYDLDEDPGEAHPQEKGDLASRVAQSQQAAARDALAWLERFQQNHGSQDARR